MALIDPFLKTKLHIPYTRNALVRRSRILSRLLEGFRGPLTLVTAPAGYGKTTLVVSGIVLGTTPAAWLSLDKADNPFERFLNYLVKALQVANPAIGEGVLEILASGQAVDADAVISFLINDLDRLDAPVILVLDDYHAISNPAVHAGVAFLLDHCPQTLHLVITTRSDPPLPLARLRARGQMVELRAADLRFTQEEAEQFLNEGMGLRLDPQAIQALEGRTEGWIAGLQMAALSLQNRTDVGSFIAGFSGTNRYILDYLVEEVLANQPPEVQHFLLATSILDRMCAPLCDALFQPGEVRAPGLSSAALLDLLDRSNLFLVTLESGAPNGTATAWYRYHHLFAELLRSRLSYLHPELIPELHRRAAWWLEKNGMTVEAVNHALLGGAHDQAARLVEENTTILLASGELIALMGWINVIPEDLRRSRPRLCIHQAYALAFAGKLQGIEELLHQAECAIGSLALDPAEIQTLEGMIASVRAMAAVMAGRDREGISEANRALGLLSATQDWDRATVAWAQGYAERSLGNLRAASQAFEEMVRLARKMGNPWTLVTGLMDLAMVVRAQGQLRQSRLLFEEALRSANQLGARGLGYIARIEAGLASVLYEQNELEPAQQLVNDAIAHIGHWPNPNHLAYAGAIQSRLRMAEGDLAGARHAIEQANVVRQTETLVRITRRMIEAGLVRVWLQLQRQPVVLATGDSLDRTCAVLVGEWSEEINGSFRDAYDEAAISAALMLARISLYHHQPEDGLPMVRKVLEQVQRMGNISAGVEAYVLLALLLKAANPGQKRDAFDSLETALRFGQAGGFVRTFVEEGRPLQDLLAQWLAQSGEHPLRSYARDLLDLMVKEAGPNMAAPAVAKNPQPIPEPLSQREIEVLTLIAQGLTNDGIARQLIISTGTVKAHTAAIYRKLDVINRTEAVARARQLQILP